MAKRKTGKRPIVLAVVSDVHAGGTTSVCPPEGVRLEDGGRYMPTKLQQWLWAKWNHFWGRVGEVRDREGADLGIAFNGDCVEGAHHGTTQVASHNLEAQAYIAERVFSVPQLLAPQWIWVARGTAAHVGQGAAAEEALARSMKAQPDPETEAWTSYRWRLDLHGVLVDILHHGRSSSRPWLTGSAAGILGSEIWYRHLQRGEQPPALAFRAHKHSYYDSHDLAPTRVLMTPSWQAHTGHAHKVVPEILPEFGGLITVIHPDGRLTVDPVLYRPKHSTPWRP